ncbi:SMAD/FHA domain-containing protein [Fennellomyces sp. T-0311]|nr:SMAD/FHA domain-containing protein [Fennellomyces sp. T-0311]
MSDDNFAIPAAPKRKDQDIPPLPYEKPEWSSNPIYDYGFEVLKGGLSLDKIKGPRKEFVTIGRLPLCDIQMEHPEQSVSRYHAILQFNHDGNAFIYDLDSAHGTRVNKQRVPCRQHVALQPGDQVRFGESTRLCIFETDKQLDEEEEIEKEEAIRNRSRASMTEHAAEDDDDQGISWGFREDAEEEPEEDEQEEGQSGDAALIDVVKEKMMVEDAKRRREELDIMYESDEEGLYDKTGKAGLIFGCQWLRRAVAAAPKKKKTKKTNKAETYEDLVERKKQTEKEIQALEADIDQRKTEEPFQEAGQKVVHLQAGE